ncbi:hypothetical protein AcV5_006053 [Taiwanofungus camphoratus]|nr:hypothetical protein AcV5_006053 [Antrodia cinnamomea]
MSATDVARPLRALLESAPDAPPLPSLLAIADSVVSVLRTSSAPGPLLLSLEDELQAVYDDVINHAVPAQGEIFLAVLHRLRPVLPPASLIETWFDLVLRPALREPRLAAPAADQAKELILAALDPDNGIPAGLLSGAEMGAEVPEEERDKQRDKVGRFRRRLMELYLLDAFNESSGDDVLEWAKLDSSQREKKAFWKANLEDVLVRLGLERPQDFLTEVYHCFVSPSSRLQLLVLLNTYTSQPTFPDYAPALAAHTLTTSLLHSLLFDGSSTVAVIALSVVTKLLPIFAVRASAYLKRLLPLLLAILARIICWRERELSTPPSERDPDVEDDAAAEEDKKRLTESVYAPPTRDDIEWERLEQAFHGATSSTPSAHRYFTFLYYLFPCNVIRFLRLPVQYLKDNGLDSPYTIDWDDVLDEDKIRSKSEVLLRGHVLHPLLIWRNPTEELSEPDFWSQYDIARIVGDCSMLDVRNASLIARQRPCPDTSDDADIIAQYPVAPVPATSLPPGHETPAARELASPTIQPASPHSEKPRVSLQDMIAASVALKSGLDVEVVPPSSAWSAALFLQPRTRSPSRSEMGDAEPAASPSSERASKGKDREEETDVESMRPVSERSRVQVGEQEDVPSHVAQALSGLQREVLLLRNELNFELWNARENVRHIGRLYQDRVLSKTAEIERQALHNKLREYKQEVLRLQRELKNHKAHASAVKTQYADWNQKLQDTLKDFRRKKAAWEEEAAAMRLADKEAKATFEAREKLLAQAVQKVFQLETKIKENAHKVDRLHDYEQQIDQLIKLQRLWELDVQKLNEQAEYLQVFTSKYRKMELRLETYEKTQVEMEQDVQNYRRQNKSLEARLVSSQRQLEGARKSASLANLSTAHVEISRLKQTNQRLRDENAELTDEVEEVKAMVELLKAQVSERRGRASEGGRSSSAVGEGT